MSGRQALYSLEKLIEWKHLTALVGNIDNLTLYSLEKLIEWKPEPLLRAASESGQYSLLAREIN